MTWIIFFPAFELYPQDMHERSLLADLLHKLKEIVAAHPGNRLAEVRVRLGEWTHMTPEHFLEHFQEMAAGTPAEGARVAILPGRPEEAQHVVLESVELE